MVILTQMDASNDFYKTLLNNILFKGELPQRLNPFNCRICLLEFFNVFNLKTNQKRLNRQMQTRMLQMDKPFLKCKTEIDLIAIMLS